MLLSLWSLLHTVGTTRRQAPKSPPWNHVGACGKQFQPSYTVPGCHHASLLKYAVCWLTCSLTHWLACCSRVSPRTLACISENKCWDWIDGFTEPQGVQESETESLSHVYRQKVCALARCRALLCFWLFVCLRWVPAVFFPTSRDSTAEFCRFFFFCKLSAQTSQTQVLMLKEEEIALFFLPFQQPEDRGGIANMQDNQNAFFTRRDVL